MTQPGRAAIEIVGDVSHLGAQLERDVQKAINSIDVDTTQIGDRVGDGFKKGAAEGTQALEGLNDTATEAFDKIEAAAEDAAGAIGDSLEKASGRISRASKKARRDSESDLEAIGEAAKGATEAVGRGAGEISKTFSTLGNSLVSIGSALVGLGASAPTPAGLIAIGAAIVGLIALIGPMLALGAALADLVGLITIAPAGIFVAVGAVAALAIAFQGFGDAISAVLDGDPEKIAEALEKLAPAARTVVREFQALLPQFRALGDAVQQALFAELEGQLTRLTKATLPALRVGLSDVASAFGEFFEGLVGVAVDPDTIRLLNRGLAATGDIIRQAIPGVRQLFSGLILAADALLPTLENISAALFDAVGAFGVWLGESARSGELQAFFDDAVATVGELIGLFKAIGGLTATLFGSADDEGRDFIGTLTDLVQRLDEFFKSAEGQDTLNEFINNVKTVGAIIAGLINTVIFAGQVFSLWKANLVATIGSFVSAGKAIGEFWDGLVEGVSSAASSVGDWFTQIGSDIEGFWDGLVQNVSSAVDSIVTFFGELPGKILGFIQGIPDFIAGVFDAAIDQAINILAFGIAAVIVFFTDLPGQVASGLQALLALVLNTFNDIGLRVSEAFDAVVEFVLGLPERITEGFNAFVALVSSTFELVRTEIVGAITAAIQFVSGLPLRFAEFFQRTSDAVDTKTNSMIEFVRSIPRRIGEALGNTGRMLYDAGAKIINGLIDGIKSRFNQLKEAISTAVQNIRDHLPFSPAKIGPLSGSGDPTKAGATIAEMIASGIDSQLGLITAAAGRAAGSVRTPLGAVGDAGVTPLIGPTTAATTPILAPTTTSTQEQPTFVVQIGNEEIEAFITKIVQQRVEIETRRVLAGTRG